MQVLLCFIAKSAFLFRNLLVSINIQMRSLLRTHVAVTWEVSDLLGWA